MMKKIAIGLIFTLIVGVLVVGAANRTSAKTAQYNPAETAAQTGNGGGQNSDGERQYANQHEPLYIEKEQTGQGGQGQGTGNGRSTTTTDDQTATTPLGGQGQGNVAGNGQGNGAQNQDADRYGNPEAPTSHDEIITYQGTISTAPTAGVELVISTAEGDVVIGTGPSYWLEANIILAAGDNISVTGFWEEGEFKATSLTRTSDNLTVTLRDELGRPMWSGSVRNSANGQGQGRGQGQGQGNGKGQG
ncbi:MAG: hypothetical protein IAF02_17170 [Anaerolineae bacterium]|nr:hypothetical protein [Anaerolineae bacterium]